VSLQSQTVPRTQPSYPGDYDGNIVALWLRIDPVRWISGVLAGAFAGGVALVVAMLISQSAGKEFWFPAKLASTPFLGSVGTDNSVMTGAIVGLIAWEVLGMFWGFVYSHFVGSNSMKALVPMGVVWGLFLWVFNWNLFFQSVLAIRWAGVSAGVALLLCLIYGLLLPSVAFFDRAFRGK
jgi:hypothetical protein